MENIQKFRKKGKKLGEYMMTKLRLLRDQKKYRSRGVTLKYMLDRVDSRDLIIVFKIGRAPAPEKGSGPDTIMSGR